MQEFSSDEIKKMFLEGRPNTLTTLSNMIDKALGGMPHFLVIQENDECTKFDCTATMEIEKTMFTISKIKESIKDIKSENKIKITPESSQENIEEYVLKYLEIHSIFEIDDLESKIKSVPKDLLKLISIEFMKRK